MRHPFGVVRPGYNTPSDAYLRWIHVRDHIFKIPEQTQRFTSSWLHHALIYTGCDEVIITPTYYRKPQNGSTSIFGWNFIRNSIIHLSKIISRFREFPETVYAFYFSMRDANYSLTSRLKVSDVCSLFGIEEFVARGLEVSVHWIK